MANMIGGFKDKKVESRSKVENTTVQYIGQYRQGLDVNSQIAYVLIGTDLVEDGSSTTIINATAHVAKVGDIISFTSGTLSGDLAYVQEVATNTITLSQNITSAPGAGVGFSIVRPGYVQVDASGNLSVTISGSLPLPAGAATAANQASEISLLTTISGFVGSLDGKTTTVDTDNVTVISMPTVTITPQALTSTAPTTVSVGTSSTSVLSSSTRKKLVFTNTSSNVISLAFNNTAVLNSGVTLTGYGSSFVLDGPITSTVTAIASVAASSLGVQVFT